MATQFVTNAKGEKVAALTPIKEYEELMEDLTDIAACLELRDEETIPWEQVKKELIEEGVLSR